MSQTVLIVEDEPKLAELISDYLVQASFQTHIINNGLEVTPWLESNDADMIILDLMLPGLDGLSVCRAIRAKWETPIIMATAKVEEIDRLLGLEAGADDYICKPFSFRELVARVQAILRRLERMANAPRHSPPRGDLRLDADRMIATLHGQRLDLTAVEFNLLNTLAEDPGRIFNREQLMARIYQEYRVVSDRTIDSHVKKLRQKLKVASNKHEYIHSVYGMGYKFEPAG